MSVDLDAGVGRGIISVNGVNGHDRALLKKSSSSSASWSADDLDYYDHDETHNTTAVDANLPALLYWSTVANRCLHKPVYSCFIITLFVMQTVLFIWGMVNHGLFSNLRRDEVWYIVLDVIITMLMLIEVSIRICATTRSYFRSCWNVVDLILIVACVASLGLYSVDHEAVVYGEGLMALRYLAQVIRMIIMIKHHRDRRRMAAAAEGSVDFSQLNRLHEQQTADLSEDSASPRRFSLAVQMIAVESACSAADRDRLQLHESGVLKDMQRAMETDSENDMSAFKQYRTPSPLPIEIIS